MRSTGFPTHRPNCRLYFGEIRGNAGCNIFGPSAGQHQAFMEPGSCGTGTGCALEVGRTAPASCRMKGADRHGSRRIAIACFSLRTSESKLTFYFNRRSETENCRSGGLRRLVQLMQFRVLVLASCVGVAIICGTGHLARAGAVFRGIGGTPDEKIERSDTSLMPKIAPLLLESPSAIAREYTSRRARRPCHKYGHTPGVVSLLIS